MTRRALVLGLGRFGGGREAAAFLLRGGWQVRVADKAGRASLAESIAVLTAHPQVDSIEWCLEREDEDLLADIDLLVCNPAIADAHPLLAAARHRAIPVTQETNLFLEHYPGRVVLVTGTNGKSTTTTLLEHALRAGGADVLAGGNLGKSLLAEQGAWHARQIAVLEISSFQHERCDPARHSVAGAVVLFSVAPPASQFVAPAPYIIAPTLRPLRVPPPVLLIATV